MGEDVEKTRYIMTARYQDWYNDFREEFDDVQAAIKRAKKMPRGVRDTRDTFGRRHDRINVRVVQGVRGWLSYAELGDDGIWETGQGKPSGIPEIQVVADSHGGEIHLVYAGGDDGRITAQKRFDNATEAENYILENMETNTRKLVILCHVVERTEVIYASPKSGSSLSW